MDSFIPKYINQDLAYRSREVVTAEDYNRILNLLIIASDYNSEVLNSMINDAETKLILQAIHADEAALATLALNSSALSGATLSTSSSTLAADDTKVPTAKQAKAYVDAAINTVNSTTSALGISLTNTIAKNAEQDGRLSNIESVNNSYGNRITVVENRATALEGNISAIQQVDINQDGTLANHNLRITNLELQEVPENVVDTLMLKANFAKLVAPGEYSETTVALADRASNVVISGNPVSGNNIAQTSQVTAVSDVANSPRGALSNPAGAYYSVAELKALKPGVYSVSGTNAGKLNAGAAAGFLIKETAGSDVVLAFATGTTTAAAYPRKMYIPSSTSDAVLINTLAWEDKAAALTALIDDITALETNSLVVGNLLAGDDVSIDKVGNNATINYTGPKIVLSATQPTADPERTILWIQT